MVPRLWLDNYTAAINELSRKSRDSLTAALALIDLMDDVAEVRAQVVALMNGVCGAATSGTAQLSRAFYNAIRQQELGSTIMGTLDCGRDPQATDGAVRAFADKLVKGDPQAFVNLCVSRVDYEIKVAAAQTCLNNAKVDPVKPRFARVPTGDETCDFCLMLASRGFVYHTEAAASHAHANCVVAGTQVSGTGLLAGMRRKYEGSLVSIRTSGGRDLTVTPNHPILTTRGWVLAGEIKEFDHLVCTNFDHWNNRSIPDVYDVPPMIDEVFKACDFVNSTVFHGMPVTTKDFNGKVVRDGDIKVINPCGFLKRAGESSIGEPFNHCRFAVAHSDASVSCLLLNGLRMKNLFRNCLGATSDCCMCGASLGGSFFRSHCSSSDDSSFGVATGANTSIGEPSSNGSAADIETAGDGVDAFSILERFDDPFRHFNSLAMRLDTIAAQYSIDGGLSTSDNVANLLGSFARYIEIDDVDSISVSESVCHVYNLSTAGGWYVSSGIITHNCDCRVVPSWKAHEVEGYDPDALAAAWVDAVEEKAARRAARKGTDIDTERQGIMDAYARSAKNARLKAKLRKKAR